MGVEAIYLSAGSAGVRGVDDEDRWSRFHLLHQFSGVPGGFYDACAGQVLALQLARHEQAGGVIPPEFVSDTNDEMFLYVSRKHVAARNKPLRCLVAAIFHDIRDYKGICPALKIGAKIVLVRYFPIC